MKKFLLNFFLVFGLMGAGFKALAGTPVFTYTPSANYPVNTAMSLSPNVTTAPVAQSFTTPGTQLTGATLTKPYGMAYDNAGNLYVVNYTGGKVMEYNSSGAYVNTFTTGLTNPTSIAIDASNNVYVGTAGGGIYKYNTSFAAQSFTPGTTPVTVYGMTTDAAGNLYVADNTGGIIDKFSPSGALSLQLFYNSGPASGYIFDPVGVQVDALGNIYVLDNSYDDIVEFSSAGAFVSRILLVGTLNNPFGFYMDASGNFYVGDPGSGTVRVYNSGGTSLTTLTPTGGTKPRGVIVDSKGNLYVDDYANSNLYKYVPVNGYAITSGTLPAGLTFNGFTGTISGTPTTNGSYPLTVTGYGSTGNLSIPFTITIAAAARPALSYTTPVYNITYGSSVNTTISNSGGAPTSTYTVTSGTLPSGLTLNPTTGAITGIPNVTTMTTIGVNASNSAGSSLVAATLTITVAAAPLTVTATGPPKPYGTALTAGTSTTYFTASAAASGQAVTSVTLTPDANGMSSTTAVGLPYVVTPSAATGSGGFLASNYNITYVPYTGTVTKGNLTITANGVSKVYGNTLTGGSGSTAFTPTGLANGETVGSVTIAYGTGSAMGDAVGTYSTITPSAATGGTFNPANYNITYTNGVITVTGAPLTLTATGPAKTYGTALTTGTSSTNFTYSGAVPGQTITSVTFTITGTGKSATGAAGSTYVVAPSAPMGTGGFVAGNYTITPVNYNGTVAQAPLTITAAANNKPYGTVLTGGNITTGFTYTGIENSETVGRVTATYGTGSAATDPIGTYTGQITIAGAAGGTFTASNYSITYVPGNIVVTQAALTITANSISKVYGNTLTGGAGSTAFTSTGLAPGETIGSVTITYGTGSGATDAVGTYSGQVTPSAATGGTFNTGNYTIAYVSGSITVTPQPPSSLNYSPSTNNYTAGTMIPNLTPTYSGGAVPASAYGAGTALTGAAFSEPWGIAFDKSGNLYVTNYNSGTVDVFNSGGSFSRSFTTPGGSPVGIAFDSAGNAYVLDNTSDDVYEYNTSGNLVATLAPGGGFLDPTSITIDGSNNLYVTDDFEGTVTKFNTSGTVLATITSNLNIPENVALDGSGNIYVLNNGNGKVTEYNSSGVYLGVAVATGFNDPYGLLVDGSGNIYVSNTSSGGNGKVSEYNSSGMLITTITGLTDPDGIAEDKSGNLYVSDFANNSVSKYPPVGGFYLSGTLPPGLSFSTATGTFSGTPTAAFPSTTYTVTCYNAGGSSSTMVILSCTVTPLAFSYTPSTNVYAVNAAITPLIPNITSGSVSALSFGTGESISGGTLSFPVGAAIDPTTGNIYVANYANNAVTEYDKNGNYLATISTPNSPDNIVFDSSGNAFLITNGGSVYKYTGGFSGTRTTFLTGLNNTGGGPLGIAIDASNNIYVTSSKGTTNSRVYKYAGTGTTAGGILLTISTNLSAPSGVAVDAAGNIYVSNYGNGTIYEYNSGGTSQGRLISGTNISGPFGISIDGAGNVYLANTTNNVVDVINPVSNTLVTSFSSPNPGGVVVDSSGDAFVTDLYDGTLLEYPPFSGFYLSGTLPPGLSFNTTTGTFSGKPTSAFPATVYTVTAYSYGTKATTTVTISCVLSYDWVGTVSSDWNNPGNWTTNAVPGTTNTANIGVNAAFTNQPTISATGPAAVGVLAVIFGNQGGQAPTLTVNSPYALTVTNDITRQSDGNSTAGYVATLAGAGTIKVTNLNVLANTSTAPGTYTEGVVSTSSGLTLTGNVVLTSINSTYATKAAFTVSGGITNLAGTVLTTNVSGSSSALTVSGGTLQFVNAAPLSTLSTAGTNTLSFTGTGTVEYAGAGQTVYTDAVIPGLTAGPTYQSIKFSGSGIKAPNGGNLKVAGDFTNALTLNDASDYISLASTPVYFNGVTQNLYGGNGTGTVFNNVTFNGTGTAAMGSGNFYVKSTGLLTMSGSSATLVAGDYAASPSAADSYLTLMSDVNGTATIPVIPAGCTIKGNVNVQRYLSGDGTTQGYRGYRMLSSPVTANSSGISLKYLANSCYTTGSGGTGGGFYATGNPTLYFFRENLVPSNVSFTSGNYRGVASIASAPNYTMDVDGGLYNLPAANGYLFFFRGDKSAGTFTAETTTSYAPTATTLTATGFLNEGTVAFNTWYTTGGNTGLLYSTTSGTATVEGFNLAGNPYASSIDWDKCLSGGINTTNMGANPYIYILDPVSKTYNVYQAGGGLTGTPGVGTISNNSNIIASGQGFFVVAGGSGATLSFTENAKTNTQVSSGNHNLFLGAPPATADIPYMQLQMSKDSVNRDGIFIRFNSSASANYVPYEDAPYQNGFGAVSLSSMAANNISLAVNTLPFPKQSQTIPLKINATADGLYAFNMKSIRNIPDLYDVWLMDAYTKDSLDIKHNPDYGFNVLHADTNSFGSKRFSLVVRINPALGLHLLNFTANKVPAGASIQWVTENEQNYTNFTVERSTDNGATYNVLGGFVSSAIGTYTFLDNNPGAVDKYRLKLQDVAGNITYSNIVTLMYANANKVASNISIYPNPTTSMINLAINQSTASTSGLQSLGTSPVLNKGALTSLYDIKITSMSGSVVKSVTTTSSSWQENVNSLLPGTYIIQVMNSSDKSVIGKGTFVKL